MKQSSVILDSVYYVAKNYFCYDDTHVNADIRDHKTFTNPYAWSKTHSPLLMFTSKNLAVIIANIRTPSPRVRVRVGKKLKLVK